MSEKPTPPSPLRSQSTWLGFARWELTGYGTMKLRLCWGRIGLLFLFLLVGAWGLKSYALYYFFKEVRAFEDVAFTDMVKFPFNRSNVRVQQGNYQIEAGLASLEREDYRRAYILLKEGVIRSPGNVEGRMTLAQIYAGWRPDLAVELLVDGIDYGKNDQTYIALTVNILLNQKEDATILDLTETYLPGAEDPQIRQLLMVARLQAAMHLGRFDLIQDLFEKTDLANSMDGILYGSRLYEIAGREDYAIRVLLSVIRSVKNANLEPVYNRLVNIYKASGSYDRAREMALDQIIRNPLEWNPRVLLIDVLAASDQPARRDQEINSLIAEYRDDERAMNSLAQLSAQYGLVDTATRLYEIALENGYPLAVYSLTLAEASVNNTDYEQAIALCQEIVDEDPAWLGLVASNFNAIRSLAHFGAGDAELGNLYLDNFIAGKRTTISQFQQAGRSYREFGLPEQALRILEKGHELDPDNEQILALLIQVEMDLGVYFSLEEHIRHLFTLRRTAYSVYETLHERLQSDRFLFTAHRPDLLSELARIIHEREAMDWEIWDRSSNPAS